jgi:hypothetical protein
VRPVEASSSAPHASAPPDVAHAHRLPHTGPGRRRGRPHDQPRPRGLLVGSSSPCPHIPARHVSLGACLGADVDHPQLVGRGPGQVMHAPPQLGARAHLRAWHHATVVPRVPGRGPHLAHHRVSLGAGQGVDVSLPTGSTTRAPTRTTPSARPVMSSRPTSRPMLVETHATDVGPHQVKHVGMLEQDQPILGEVCRCRLPPGACRRPGPGEARRPGAARPA